MDLLINGSTVNVPKEVETIVELMQHLELNSPVIIVEHNDEILKKDEHKQTNINNGDKVEFIQFVGGG